MIRKIHTLRVLKISFYICLAAAFWVLGVWAESPRLSGGDVSLHGVPMVDQGDRAYCITASLERVLRYNGIEADQGELAELTRTDPQRGIDLQKLLPPLRPFLASRGVKLKTLYLWKTENFVSLMQRYNAAARRAGVPEISLRSRILHVPTCLRQVDYVVFRAVRLREKRAYQHFLDDVAREIGEGRPLLWSVQQDVAPQSERPASGGHMRLIVGLNPATREIIYSDSWGAGYEARRMSGEDAWVMTSGLLRLAQVARN